MQVVDKYGNTFGQGHLIITSKSGKSKLPVVTVAWGNITGVLANQTDLQDALNLKVPTARTITINGVTQDLTANRTWTISTGITVDTTPITGGTSSRLLFDNAGTVGETSGINWNSSTATLSLLDSPFYSQAGNSFANTVFSITGTASSNYTIYSSRQFIFNTGQSMYFNTDTDGGSALDRAWYFAGARTGITGGRTYGALTVNSSGFPSFTLYNNDNGARILLASNATSYFNGGNLLVGTTTDAGFKFDVIGSTRVTSLKTADIFPASANISLWTNSLNASSRFYTAPVHQDGRINFNAIAGGSDQVLIRTWHTGQFGLGTGSSSAGGALTVRGDSLLIGTAGALYFMNGTFGPNNVPYRLAISTTATTTSFYSGVTNNLTNIESTKFEYTATSHTFYTGTTAGNQANPNQYTPLHLSNLGNVTIGTTTDAGFRLDVNGTSRIQGVLTAAGNYIQYGTNPNVGIGSTNNGNSFVNNGPALLYASANINATQVYAHNFFTGSFNSTSGVQGLANLTGANFSPTSGTAVFNTINATPTINQTGGASGITRGLYINPTLTAAADFRAIETTVGNVLFGTTSGNVGIGSNTAPYYPLQITQSTINNYIELSGTTNKGIYASGSGLLNWDPSGNMNFYTGGVNLRATISSVGNFLIGTSTDAGYKLDVNGTAIIGDSSNYGTVFKVRTPGSGWNFDYQYLSLGTVLKLGLDRLELRVNNNTAYIGNNGDSSNASLTVMSGHDAAATSFAPIIFGSGRNASLTREVMRIDNQNKYVGIGTSTPSYKLHTVGSAGFDNGASGDAITILNSGYIQSSLIRFRGFSTQFVIQDNSYNTKFVVSTSGSFSYFNTGGNVGINTTTDSGYTLNVNGTGYFNSRVDLSANSPLTLGGGGNNQAGVSLWGTQNASNGWDGWIGRNLEYNGTNYIYKTTNANNYWGTVAGIRTLGTGNLALGFIARPATGEGSNVIATDLNTYTRLAILYNGNVGIGTTTPSAVLHIQSPAGGRSTLVFIRAMNSAAEPAIQFANSANNLAKIGGISGGGLYFENATTELMRISSTGNLLLNTTTDSGYKLDVNGTSIYRESLTNTIGGFLHKSTSTSNDAFWSIVSGSVYFIVSAGGYCKTTSNLVTEATGVGTINASAISQIDSVTKGFLPPRMTNAQMLAIATPAEGLMVYDTTNRKLCCYDGATWQNLF